MPKEYSKEDLTKLRRAMENHLCEMGRGNNIKLCAYCKKEKIDVWDKNFIPLCSSCNIDISQMLEYFFNKYPEMIEEILSIGNPQN
jgi:hypothetical protein